MASVSFISQLKWCWSLTRGYSLSFGIYYMAELLAIASSLTFVVSSKRAIDYAISGNKPEMMNALYWSITLIAFSIVFKFISTKCNELSKMKMLKDLQNNVAKRQMFSSWEYMKSWSTGDIQFRIQRDCNEVIQMIAQIFPNFTLTIIRLIASVSLLWVMDSRLALIILILTPLFLFSKIYYNKFRKLNKELKSKEGILSHIINENLKFRMLIRTLGIEHQRWRKFTDNQDDILRLKKNILNFSMLSQTIIKTTVNIGFLFTFVWGVLGLNSGSISFGTLTAFLQLVGRVQNPMLGMIGFFPSFIAFGVAVERVQEILSGKIEEVKDRVKLQNIEQLEIKNLSFSYDDKFVLNNLNLTFQRGESTAILGPSGRGKTTLIRLLLAVIYPQKGNILLYYNGISTVLNDSHRINFGYVPQGDKLFSGTIRENLLVENETISGEMIDKALFDSCSEFVYELPKGLDTLIGESGYGLSEGQMQRLAIARTLLSDAQIWLFDEVTSSLDKETSRLLMKRLKKIGENKVFVFVTHDIQLAEYCDKIYHMN